MRIENRRKHAALAIATASLCAMLVDASYAQQPERARTSQATDQNRNSQSFTPVACRAIQLQSTAKEMNRTVVTATAADPAGHLLAVAGDDHVIRIFQSSSLQVIKTLRGHRDWIRTIAFDPDGRRLVSAGNDGQLIVWDCTESFRIIQRMRDSPALRCVRFSPTGDEIASVGFDRTVFLIGKPESQRSKLRCDCSDLRAVAYREDGQLLVAAGRSGNLHLFNRNDGRLIGEYPAHRRPINDIAFQDSSDELVSVGEDGDVVVFDTARRRVLRRCNVSTGKLFAVAILDGRHVAVAGSDNTVRIVNIEDARVVHRLEGHHGSVPSLCAIGGWLFSGSYDATLRQWSIQDVKLDEQRIAESDASIER